MLSKMHISLLMEILFTFFTRSTVDEASKMVSSLKYLIYQHIFEAVLKLSLLSVW